MYAAIATRGKLPWGAAKEEDMDLLKACCLGIAVGRERLLRMYCNEGTETLDLPAFET